MLKYSLILIAVYFLYYVVNIVYDLFLKKEKTVATDEFEEFSLVSFARTESPPESRIEIDDVENIRTPKSFQKMKPPITSNIAEVFDQPDLEEMRRKFEAEEELDDGYFASKSNESITPLETEEEPMEDQLEYEEEFEEEAQKAFEKEQKDMEWTQMMTLAETSIKVVNNYDGQKVYHSTI